MSMSQSGFDLSDLAEELRTNNTSVQMRLGTVSAISGNTCSVKVAGSTTDAVGVSYINYSPVVGDVVLLFQDGPDLIIWGKPGSGGSSMSVPIGAIVMWGNTLPSDWQLCEGQSTAGNAALAAVWGSNVPDLRYRFVRGAGVGLPNGTQGGNDVINLSVAQMPAHSHSTPDHQHTISNTLWTDQTTHTHSGHAGALAEGSEPWSGFSAPSPLSATGGGGVTGVNGAGTNIDAKPPFYVVTFIIKVA